MNVMFIHLIDYELSSCLLNEDCALVPQIRFDL